MRPRILVTGATGTVGALVAQKLCARGVSPVALAHTPDNVRAAAAACAEARVADLRDDLDRACRLR
jgi:uncharacterized protein YbjT (DUF2867 family)